jgi:hypothetical protein
MYLTFLPWLSDQNTPVLKAYNSFSILKDFSITVSISAHVAHSSFQCQPDRELVRNAPSQVSLETSISEFML